MVKGKLGKKDGGTCLPLAGFTSFGNSVSELMIFICLSSIHRMSAIMMRTLSSVVAKIVQV